MLIRKKNNRENNMANVGRNLERSDGIVHKVMGSKGDESKGVFIQR